MLLKWVMSMFCDYSHRERDEKLTNILKEQIKSDSKNRKKKRKTC